ncbi:MAG TPA: sulfotransferase [Xanthobacteraceae bacterium]|nr:sulfotransferase [Xanthobacteraceae bacterium]
MRIWEAVRGTATDIISTLAGEQPRLATKYFVLSLHRSGTRSVTELFEKFGLRTVHWPDRNNGFRLQPKILGRERDRAYVLDVIEPVINKNDAVADVPIPVLYHELDERYPNAKFLLLRRKPGDWIRSVRRHVADRPFRPYERVQYWHYFPSRPSTLTELSDADLTEMCERHVSQVTDYFSGRGEKFASLNLESAATGADISKFLGHDSNTVLPHITDASNTA